MTEMCGDLTHKELQKTRIAVITLFPEMFTAITDSGITRRAFEQELLELKLVNPREFADDKHRTVDDRPYGGGPGMVMKIEPLEKALRSCFEWLGVDFAKCKSRDSEVDVFYMSPQGVRLDNQYAKALSQKKNMIFIAGRYEGVDERFIRSYVSHELSIGDYVLSGGELPVMVAIDSLTRRLPGALGDGQSAEQDSFEDGLLDCPHFTRPEVYNSERVPGVLLSGDHAEIEKWRQAQSLKKTYLARPDLLENLLLSPEQEALLKTIKRKL